MQVSNGPQATAKDPFQFSQTQLASKSNWKVAHLNEDSLPRHRILMGGREEEGKKGRQGGRQAVAIC